MPDDEVVKACPQNALVEDRVRRVDVLDSGQKFAPACGQRDIAVCLQGTVGCKVILEAHIGRQGARPPVSHGLVLLLQDVELVVAVVGDPDLWHEGGVHYHVELALPCVSI